MIKLTVNEQVIAIPGEALSDAVIDHAPPWLVGNAPAPHGKIGAFLSLLSSAIPFLLNLMYMDAKKRGAVDIPPPDFKSPAARRNTIAYTIRYLLDNFAVVAAKEEFKAEGEVDADGIFHITNIVSTGPVVGLGAKEAGRLDPVPSLPGGVG